MKAGLDLRAIYHVARNDQRVLWRELNRAQSVIGRTTFSVIVLLALFQFLSWVVFGRLKMVPSGIDYSLSWFYLTIILFFGCMNRAITALYDEADLQLLFSSPLKPSTVLAARLISIATTSFLPAGILILPVTNTLVFRYGVRFSAGYVVWPVISVAAAALSVIVVVAVVRSFGLRVGRFVAQGLGVLSVTIPIIVTALHDFLPGIDWGAVLTTIGGHPAIAIIGRAALGGLPELSLLLLLMFGSWLCATFVMERAFLEGVHGATTVSHRIRMREHYWRDGLLQTFVLKDLRLLIRHPPIAGQLFYYAFIALISAPLLIRTGGAVALVPLALYLTGSVTLELAYNAHEAEVAWDINAQSPISDLKARALKAASCLVFPLLAMVGFSGWIALIESPILGCVTFLASALCAASAAWLVLGRQVFLTAGLLLRQRRVHTLVNQAIVLGSTTLATITATLVKTGHAYVATLTFFSLAIILVTGFALTQPNTEVPRNRA